MNINNLRLISLLTFLLLISCSSSRYYWGKDNQPNATANDLDKIKFICLQKSQQNYSTSNLVPSPYGGYMGVTNQGVTTNNDLFYTCMNANGWYEYKYK